MAVKKISPKSPDAKATAAKGEKLAEERKTASVQRKRKVGRTMLHKK